MLWAPNQCQWETSTMHSFSFWNWSGRSVDYIRPTFTFFSLGFTRGVQIHASILDYPYIYFLHLPFFCLNFYNYSSLKYDAWEKHKMYLWIFISWPNLLCKEKKLDKELAHYNDLRTPSTSPHAKGNLVLFTFWTLSKFNHIAYILSYLGFSKVCQLLFNFGSNYRSLFRVVLATLLRAPGCLQVWTCPGAI